MPKIVIEILMVIGSTAMVGAGVWMIFWPDAAVRRMPELSEDATPAQARRGARFVGAVLVFFGWVGLHLVLVEGVRPFPPGEAPLGF